MYSTYNKYLVCIRFVLYRYLAHSHWLIPDTYPVYTMYIPGTYLKDTQNTLNMHMVNALHILTIDLVITHKYTVHIPQVPSTLLICTQLMPGTLPVCIKLIPGMHHLSIQ